MDLRSLEGVREGRTTTQYCSAEVLTRDQVRARDAPKNLPPSNIGGVCECDFRGPTSGTSGHSRSGVVHVPKLRDVSKLHKDIYQIRHAMARAREA